MIILYSTDCPRCRILESKLNEKNIDFILAADITDAIDAGFMSAPVLKVDDEWMDFGTAVKWINGQETEESSCDRCQF